MREFCDNKLKQDRNRHVSAERDHQSSSFYPSPHVRRQFDTGTTVCCVKHAQKRLDPAAGSESHISQAMLGPPSHFYPESINPLVSVLQCEHECEYIKTPRSCTRATFKIPEHIFKKLGALQRQKSSLESQRVRRDVCTCLKIHSDEGFGVFLRMEDIYIYIYEEK